MKRAYFLIFALILALSMCACGAAEAAPETTPATTVVTEPATEETTVPTTEATEPPTEETVPEGTLPDGSLPMVKVPTENGVKFIGDGLKITIENERELTVTLSNIEVQDTYVIDRAEAEDGSSEASWGIEIYGTQMPFQVNTIAWNFNPGEEKEITFKNMDHSLRYRQANGWSTPFAIALSDTEAEYVRPTVSHTPNSITWQCTIPEEILDDTSMGWEGISAMVKGEPTVAKKTMPFPFDYENIQSISVNAYQFTDAYYDPDLPDGIWVETSEFESMLNSIYKDLFNRDQRTYTVQ